MATNRTVIEQNPCPECGETAEWLEEHPEEIELGCEKNHRWFVDK